MVGKKGTSETPQYAGKELRKHPRKAASLPVTFQVINCLDTKKRSALTEAVLRDISKGGLSFFTPEARIDGLHVSYDASPMQRNYLLIEVAFPPPYGPVMVLGQCVWFERGFEEARDSFAVGVEFQRFKDDGEEILSRYIKAIS
jgi:hypothetical protein